MHYKLFNRCKKTPFNNGNFWRLEGDKRYVAHTCRTADLELAVGFPLSAQMFVQIARKPRFAESPSRESREIIFLFKERWLSTVEMLNINFGEIIVLSNDV